LRFKSHVETIIFHFPFLLSHSFSRKHRWSEAAGQVSAPSVPRKTLIATSPRSKIPLFFLPPLFFSLPSVFRGEYTRNKGSENCVSKPRENVVKKFFSSPFSLFLSPKQEVRHNSRQPADESRHELYESQPVACRLPLFSFFLPPLGYPHVSCVGVLPRALMEDAARGIRAGKFAP